MKKVFSTRKYICADSEDAALEKCYIDYIMLKTEIKIPNSDIKATVYGVEISRKKEICGIETTIEKAVAKDIFATSEYTKSFICALAANRIMPSDLKVAIGSMLGKNGLEPPEVSYRGASI